MPIQRLGTLVLVVAGIAAPAASQLPWEVWSDLRSLAVLHPGHQVALRSSHCLDGCRFDRHSKGDERFLRLDGDEGVVFEERGPGAVTRIWMTAGQSGVSVPLDPATRVRFYFDGEATPRIDLALPALFDGSTAPFVAPLVGDRLASSGGNFSYVPIPFAESLRVVFAGDLTQRVWFQFGFHRLTPGAPVTSFTGEEDLFGLAARLAAPGADPWQPGGGSSTTRSLTLAAGEPQVVWATSEPGTLTLLRWALPAQEWGRVRARLAFDGLTTVDLALADLHAAWDGDPIRSLWLESDGVGALNAYFAMPYFRSASITLSIADGPPVTVDSTVRVDSRPPLAGSGRFAAQLSVADPSTVGLDTPLLVADRPGKWVGLAADLSSFETTDRQYLEGDERVFLDGLRHPTLYGTGTEDFYNAGFYFDQGPFTAALHGLLLSGVQGGEDRTIAYRFLWTDAVPWSRSIAAGLEGGPASDLRLRARTVAYWYESTAAPLAIVDTLDVGEAQSRLDHDYATTVEDEIRALDARFEGEPPTSLVADGGYRPAGRSSFTLDASKCADDLRLRRLWDAGIDGQAFEIEVDDAPAGGSAFTLGNPERRWSETDFALPVIGGGTLDIAIAAAPTGGAGEFTEFRWQLLCDSGGGEIFADGFEGGSTSAWSVTVP